jgi:cytochrome c
MSDTGKDSLLGNKIAAGVLVAGLLFWGANRIADVVVPDDAPKQPAIKLTGLATTAAPAAVAASLASIIPLIGSADVAKGAAFVQQQCSACHTLTQGGANGVGPNLYGVLGGPMFSTAGFSYSAAAKAKAKGNWNYDNMNEWLAAPDHFAPGTAMSYPGIKNDTTRADAVAYLRTLAATPLPLPTPAEIKAASAAAAPPPAPTAASTPAGAAAAPGIDTLFKTADVTKGQGVVAQQCSACHSVDKGGAAGVGPNLYGIVGAKMFAQPGFSYSDAAKAKAGGTWTADNLSDWLADPNGFAPGTAMSYAGLKNPQTRADVIAYLNKNSAAPTKLPGT